MSLRVRLSVIGALLGFTLLAYALGRRYSSSIVIYVVEQALIQKSPSGLDAVEVRQRFRAHMESFPDEEAKLQRALALSQYMEKLQRLSKPQLEALIGKKAKPIP